MSNDFVSHHFLDNENPDGGVTYGRGFSIAWNRPGSIQNGTSVETILEVASDRLKFLRHYQKTRVISRYIQALNLLEQAKALIAPEQIPASLPEQTKAKEKEITLTINVTDTDAFEDVLNLAMGLCNALEFYKQQYDGGAIAQQELEKASDLFELIGSSHEPEEPAPSSGFTPMRSLLPEIKKLTTFDE